MHSTGEVVVASDFPAVPASDTARNARTRYMIPQEPTDPATPDWILASLGVNAERTSTSLESAAGGGEDDWLAQAAQTASSKGRPSTGSFWCRASDRSLSRTHEVGIGTSRCPDRIGLSDKDIAFVEERNANPPRRKTPGYV